MEDKLEEKPPFIFSRRIFIVLVLCLTLANNYTNRNLVLQVNAATKKLNPAFATVSAKSFANLTNFNDFMSSIELSDDDLDTIYITFSIAYAIVQLPSGYIADRYGGKMLILFANVAGTFLNLITPVLVENLSEDLSIKYFFIENVLRGVFSGCLLPAVYSVLGHWIPRKEISTLCGIVLSGHLMGVTVSYTFTAKIVESNENGSSPFYIFGSIGVIISICWCFFGASTPKSAKHLNSIENLYLLKEMEKTVDHRMKEIPISKILKSLPVWAMIILTYGQTLLFTLNMEYINWYFAEIAQKHFFENRLIFFFVNLITAILCGVFADLTVNAGYLNRTVVRKFFVNLGCTGPAIFFIISTTLLKNPDLSFVLIAFGSFYQAFGAIGIKPLSLDLSPNYAGFLIALAQTPTKLISLAVYFYVKKPGVYDTIKDALLIGLVIGAISNLFFCIFGDTNIQSFNRVVSKSRNML